MNSKKKSDAFYSVLKYAKPNNPFLKYINLAKILISFFKCLLMCPIIYLTKMLFLSLNRFFFWHPKNINPNNSDALYSILKYVKHFAKLPTCLKCLLMCSVLTKKKKPVTLFIVNDFRRESLERCKTDSKLQN